MHAVYASHSIHNGVLFWRLGAVSTTARRVPPQHGTVRGPGAAAGHKTQEKASSRFIAIDVTPHPTKWLVEPGSIPFITGCRGLWQVHRTLCEQQGK